MSDLDRIAAETEQDRAAQCVPNLARVSRLENWLVLAVAVHGKEPLAVSFTVSEGEHLRDGMTQVLNEIRERGEGLRRN